MSDMCPNLYTVVDRITDILPDTGSVIGHQRRVDMRGFSRLLQGRAAILGGPPVLARWPSDYGRGQERQRVGAAAVGLVRSVRISMICADGYGSTMPQPDPAEVFVRGVWTLIPDTADVSWIDRLADQAGDDGPLGDQGPLVRRFLEAGMTAHEIARFARIVGYEVAFGFCYHLDDPTASYEGFADKDEIAWALREIDPVSDEVVGPILGMHELLLTADPTGNEMRPPAG